MNNFIFSLRELMLQCNLTSVYVVIKKNYNFISHFNVLMLITKFWNFNYSTILSSHNVWSISRKLSRNTTLYFIHECKLRINREIISKADDTVILVEANDRKTTPRKVEKAKNIIQKTGWWKHSHIKHYQKTLYTIIIRES